LENENEAIINLNKGDMSLGTIMIQPINVVKGDQYIELVDDVLNGATID
jgi:hypothetical protein